MRHLNDEVGQPRQDPPTSNDMHKNYLLKAWKNFLYTHRTADIQGMVRQTLFKRKASFDWPLPRAKTDMKIICRSANGSSFDSTGRERSRFPQKNIRDPSSE